MKSYLINFAKGFAVWSVSLLAVTFDSTSRLMFATACIVSIA